MPAKPALKWNRTTEPGSLDGCRVLILGLGIFGGGATAARFFCEHGARVTVTDLRDADQLADSLDSLRNHSIDYVLGEHRKDDIRGSDLIVVNPAVKPDSPYLACAAEHGIPCTTEINLFFQRCQLPIIGVTGSNGKSTTSALIHAILEAANIPSWLGGNIGRPLLGEPEIMQPDAKGWAVMELSSFQLWALGAIQRSPQIAVVTNLKPNHLDWHPDYAHYGDCKKQIVRHQQPSDFAIFNADDSDTKAWKKDAPAQVFQFSIKSEVEQGAWQDGNVFHYRKDNERPGLLGSRSDLHLPGAANASNFLAASTAAMLAGASPDACVEAAQHFSGLPHRLEKFATIGGVDYYNDSIATTPESTIAALDAIQKPMILILGGHDKELPFDALGEAIAGCLHVRGICLIGATAGKIEAALKTFRSLAGRKSFADFESAIKHACSHARPGDAVLLSPACASYDMFRNFQERGLQFKELVSQWAK